MFSAQGRTGHRSSSFQMGAAPMVWSCLFHIASPVSFPMLSPLGACPAPESHAGYLHTGMHPPCPIHLNLNDACGRVIVKLSSLFLPHFHESFCPPSRNHRGHSCLLPERREDSRSQRTVSLLESWKEQGQRAALDGTVWIVTRDCTPALCTR